MVKKKNGFFFREGGRREKTYTCKGEGRVPVKRPKKKCVVRTLKNTHAPLKKNNIMPLTVTTCVSADPTCGQPLHARSAKINTAGRHGIKRALISADERITDDESHKPMSEMESRPPITSGAKVKSSSNTSVEMTR